MGRDTVVHRFPLASYFVLTYALAWAGILLIAQATTAAPGEAPSSLRIGLIALPMLLAPGVAGIGLTFILEGRSGLRAMWDRLTHWRTAPGWYALALTAMPLLVLASLGVLTLAVSDRYTPTLALLGLAGLFAGYLEEIGWTGFATPRLLARCSPLMAGLQLGLLWGLWHALADGLVRADALGGFWPVTFGLFVLALIAWRVLMTWAYRQTQSGVVAQLMHFSYTGSLGLFVPVTQLSPQQDAWVYVLVAVVLWAVVLGLALGGHLRSESFRQTA